MRVKLRNLEESDFELLHKWMSAPHLKPFYMQEDIDLPQIQQKFRPRVAGDHYCFCLIASIGGVPFGYLQWYLNRSVPNYGVGEKGYLDGVSFDYFIGEPGFLGQGLGHHILSGAIALVSDRVSVKDQSFFLIHDFRNHAAVRCSQRADFEKIDEMIYNNSECGIYHWKP